MAKKLKVGDAIRGYRVTKVFGPGAMAISYAAQSSGGDKIFLKQYKSPAPTVIWYAPFVDYQQLRDAATWARHVTWAKVLMAGIAALHESKIAHADLKPPNVYLIRDPSIGSGYQLKLIDTDFSVLADRRAPWHGYQGYVGSDNYRSPEHLTRGAMPGLPSDVFTCGLILYELLTGAHPYWRDDQAEYASLVHAYAAKAPALAGVMPPPAEGAQVSATLHRCLSPTAADRPTAAVSSAPTHARGQFSDLQKKIGKKLTERAATLDSAVGTTVTQTRDDVVGTVTVRSALPSGQRLVEARRPGRSRPGRPCLVK